MIIKNKLESINKINELKINKFPEKLFKVNEEEKVKEFINKYPANYYAIRDKTTSSGLFKLKVPYNSVLDEIKDYKLYTINVSSANYRDNQLLIGEIQILKNNEIYATLTTDKDASVRDALRNPEYNIKTNIFDKYLNNIPYIDTIYEYIVDNNLQDVIVEFVLYDIKVGIKNENIVVFELRTDY